MPSSPHMWKATISITLLSFMLGAQMGHDAADPKTRVVHVPVDHTVTKVVHDPAPPPEIHNVMPESCQSALRYERAIARNADRMYARGDRQLAIVSQARMALASNGDLSKVEERQRNLSGALVGNLSDMSEAITLYTESMKNCEADLD